MLSILISCVAFQKTYRNMKIFKYCGDDNHSKENLKFSRLWFSNPENFEDKSDMNLSFLEFDLEEFRNSSIDFFNQNPELYKKYEQIFIDTNVRVNSENFSIEEMMSIMKKTYIGITCFTDTDENEYMWEEYGKNNTGFCLCLESYNDPIFFKDLTKAEYCENDLPKINLMSNNLEQQMKILSVSKRQIFNQEKEYRLFKHSSSLHEYRKESLVGVSFGKFCKSRIEIIEILKANYDRIELEL
jgi:hypothetical protein